MDKDTILVADDDTSIRKVLGEVLNRAGYMVRCASNSTRGIAMAGSERVYSSGLESVYWNPAGLARSETQQC